MTGRPAPGARRGRGCRAPAPYDALLRRRAAAYASDTVAARRELFAYYNAAVAPRLRSEEAVLQVLTYVMAQCYLEPGFPLRLLVHARLDGGAVPSYAAESLVTDVYANRAVGGLSFTVAPRQPRPGQMSLMVFRGTAPALGNDPLAERAWPCGRRDDLDPRGIGVGGFEAAREHWVAQVRQQVERGLRVTLCGHSLGATYVQRLAAVLPAELRPHVATVLFFPPGVDAATARAVPAARNRIVTVPWRDVTGMFGHSIAGGTHIRSLDWVHEGPWHVPHTVPQVSIVELRGGVPRTTVRWRGVHAAPPAGEALRRLCARWYFAAAAP